MKDIQTSNAPAPVGPYTQAKESGGFVFCSGQIAIDPKTGALSGNIAEQTARVCQNIAALLEAAGLTLQNVVKTTCFLTDPSDFAAFNEEYWKHFTSKPARSCVFVSALPKNALVEIEAIAER
jgi:2-iminobutanoate/2-iminopropanoate deaminase